MKGVFMANNNNVKITKTTEKNITVIIAVNEKIDEEFYNENLKELLDNFLRAGLLCGTTMTTYNTIKEIVITYCGQPENIEKLFNTINS